MYGQGNYAPQLGHGPPAPPPPFQQAPSPAPPPPFQQAPPLGLPPPTVPQGQLHPLPHQPPPGPPPPVYQQGPPAPPLWQSIHHPPPGTINMWQPYLHQPLPVHGSALMVHSYPQETQHGLSYPPQMTTHNMYHVPPPVPPDPRGLPPPLPPSQGQVLYRTPPPPPPGIQHVPAPPPPRCVPVTHAPFVPFIHGPTGDAHPPSLPPPPPPSPPSSPPPLPPSPPPLASTVAEIRISNESIPSEHVVDEACASEYDPVGDPVGLAQFTDDVPVHGGSPHSEAGNIDKMNLYLKGETLVNLPSSPSKPEDEVVQNIETLCKFIAKVGPHFEDLVRKNEAGNSQFSFLFGGKPGSTAAIGHEYFQWMKKKYLMDFESCNSLEQSVSSSRPLERDCTPQSCADEGAALSPAESDMDMEDDVGHPGEDQAVELNGEPEVHDAKEQLHAPWDTAEQLQSEVNMRRTESCSGTSLFPCEGQDGNDSSFTEVPSPVVSPKATEYTIDDAQGSAGPTTGDATSVKISAPASGSKNEEVPRVFVNDGSPFRLIQGYASDDSEEDDEKEYSVDVGLVRISPTTAVGTSGFHEDKGFVLYSSSVAKNVSGTETGSLLYAETTRVHCSSMPKEAVDSVGSSPDLHKEASTTVIYPGSLYAISKPGDLGDRSRDDQTSVDGKETCEGSQHHDFIEGDNVDVEHQVGRHVLEEDARHDSIVMKVDEFGRMLREGPSDSDSDGMHYQKRQGKRGRSLSRSRSPRESRWRKRSRSPWRRRDKRSRSHSWSPKKQHSRSKSPPAFRHVGEFARRDRGQPPECFHYLRGRCYRGASCWFLHNDSGEHRSRPQQYQEISHDMDNYSVYGDAQCTKESHGAKNVVKEMEVAEYDNVLSGVGKSLDLQAGHSSGGCILDTKDGVSDGKPMFDSLSDEVKPVVSSEVGQSQGIVEVNQNQGSQEVISQIQESQEVQHLQESHKVPPTTEESTHEQLENPHPLLDDSSETQASPVVETQHLHNESPLVQPFSGEVPVTQSSQASISTSLSLSEHQYVASQNPHVEGLSISHRLPAQTVQSTPFQSQVSAAQPYPVQVPVTQTLPNPTSVSQQHPNQVPAIQFHPQPQPGKEFQVSSVTTGGLHFQPSQLPPPPSQGYCPPHFPPYASQPPRGYSLQLSASNFQYQPPLMDRFPPHVPPLASDYHSLNAPPPKPTSNNLPPPPSYFDGAARPAIPNTGFGPSQIQQIAMPSRNEFPSQSDLRPYPPQEPSRVVDFHPQPYHSVAEPRSLHVDELKRRPPLVGNQQGHLFGGPSFIREEPFPCPPVAEGPQFPSEHQMEYNLHPVPPNRDEVRVPLQGQGFASSGMHPQPLSFPREPFAVQVQSFSGDSLPHRAFPRDFPYTHRSPYGLQHPSSSNFPSNLGEASNSAPSFSRYPSGSLENNLQSPFPQFGVSKIPTATHYNPFASTFEQTAPSSKFVSNVFGPENYKNIGSKYDSSFISSHASVGGPGARISASPSEARITEGAFLARPGGLFDIGPPGELTEHSFPREPSVEVPPGVHKQLVRVVPAGDQYDPLFDSIEPSSNMLNKFDQVQEQDPVVHDTGSTPKISSLHRPTDVEENNKKKVGPIHVNMLEIDEFGETGTDAEVGAVENGSPLPGDGKEWSPGIPLDLLNMEAGEIEIDQVPSLGKRKKSKESRSMKLFKIALANFVKEVLKPSWRQGNMSKEAFKTIVKKTVDKVSGAVPSHHVPKTQAKINQYVESAQRKLTKLVMGYVDKYVKM